MKSPEQKYRKRLEHYNLLLEKQKHSVNTISNLRLITAAALIGSFLYFYLTGYHITAYLSALAILLIFVYLVIIHGRAIDFQKYLEGLYTVNDMAIKRFTDEWKKFKDDGQEFMDESHPFSGDLDIFGRASLFQWINTANTMAGRKKLSDMLSKPAPNKEILKARQHAVCELAPKLWWRQRFCVEGLLVRDKLKDEAGILKWAEDRHDFYTGSHIKIFAVSLPIITLSSIILSFGLHLIPEVVFYVLAVLQFLMLRLGKNDREEALGTVYKYKDEIRLYLKMLKAFESHKFKSEYLKKLQSGLLNSRGEKAFQQIRRLEKITDRISNRENAAFIVVNILLLWDYHSMIALEKWKKECGKNIGIWINTLGEVEALCSLAGLRYDNPSWVMPEFTEQPSVLRARAMGHPLLGSKKVCNDCFIEKPVSALLITGSNMSGKSTYLRTAGINLVLAYAGAPVCAKYMKCSIMDIHTCMRVNDDLEKNISSFYAEILRIKAIVEASKGCRQVFFLLDEIFKGTNSHDRHIGASVVIKKLCANGAVGMVSTHDLELGDLERDTSSQIKNYHFREYYDDGKIGFDYKLRPGVSTTTNAIYLIRMAGIDIE